MVSKHFDEQGIPNPYETQFEFIQNGGIPGNNVSHYVHGKDLMDLVIGGTPAKTWVIPWTEMPKVPPPKDDL